MLTENQKQIVTDFFKHSESNQVRFRRNNGEYRQTGAMDVAIEIPNLGKITSMTKTGDNGLIKIKGKRRSRITSIQEPELSLLIAFMQEIIYLRENIEKACQESLPANKQFSILFNRETPISTRMEFHNEHSHANYLVHYRTIKEKLEPLGYKVLSGDFPTRKWFYIKKYKSEYIAKSFIERFICNISYIIYCLRYMD